MAIFEVLNNQQSYFNRYFRRNVGDDDYATIPTVTLAGDFVIEFDVIGAPDLITTGGHILSTSDSDSDRIYLFSGRVNVVVGGGVMVNTFDAAGIDLGAFASIMIKRTSGLFECFVDGVQLAPLTSTLYTGVVGFNSMYQKWGGATSVPVLPGILANLKIYDAGTLIHYWKINSNASTEADLVSGAIMTIINGNDSDWGLFDRQADGDWLGQELVVNGGFDSDLSGWSIPSGGWSWGAGAAILSGDGSYQPMQQFGLINQGGSYYVSCFAEGIVGVLNLTDNNGALILSATDGYNFIEHTGTASSGIEFKRNSGVVSGSIDNVSVKEVLKNA